MTDLADVDLLRFVWVDNANIIRSKSVPLFGADPGDLDRSVRISQALLSLPVHADAVVEQAGLLPTHDVTLVPDWSTLRRFDDGQAVVQCDIYDGDGPWEHCPRSFLRRMSDEAAHIGLNILAGSELEFTLLRDGVPIDSTCYAQDAAFDFDAAVVMDVLATLHAQGVPVAQCHPESGPGQWEISLKPLPVLAAADAIVAVRQVVRAVAARHGMTVTYLPLVTPEAVGAGLHVHMSFTGEQSDGFGEFGYPFIAGVLESLRPLLAVTAGSPLSLMRFRPRFWAGAYFGWGIDNKEAPLRVILNDEGAPRDVEFKAGDITANPYLMLGCLLVSGLDGIARDLELPEPLVGDPGLLDDIQRALAGIEPLPHDPAEVLAAFGDSGLFARAMGGLHLSFCAVQQAGQDHMRGMSFDEIVTVLVERI